MTDAETTSPPASLAQLSSRLVDDVRDLDAELGEVDLLVDQAKTEAARHAARSSAAADKLTALQVTNPQDTTQLMELSAQLVTLTKRAALMESQVDVLEGKRRALGRYRDAIAGYATVTADLSGSDPGGDGLAGTGLDPDAPMSAGRLAARHDDAGGPASRDLTGDARRPGPEPDQHRPAGPDRRAPRDTRPGHGPGRGPPAHRHGPADPRRHEDVHLRCPPHGPRRPRPPGHAASCRAGARPPRRASRSSSTRWARTGACRRTSSPACSGSWTTPWRPISAWPRTTCRSSWSGRLASRSGSRPRRTVEPAPAADPAQTEPPPKKKGAKEDELPPALAAMIEERRGRRARCAEAARLQDDRRLARSAPGARSRHAPLRST